MHMVVITHVNIRVPYTPDTFLKFTCGKNKDWEGGQESQTNNIIVITRM